MDHSRAHAGPAGADDHSAPDKHAGHSVAMFRNKFWITLLLTLPTLVWGEMIPGLLDFTPPPVPGARWIPVIFGTAVYFYGGWVFVTGAWVCGHSTKTARNAKLQRSASASANG